LSEMIRLCKEMKLEMVPSLTTNSLCQRQLVSSDSLEGKSVLNGEAEREGVVIRTDDKSI
jgi:hypothetical protein